MYFIDLNLFFIDLYINVFSFVLDLPQYKVLIWSFVAKFILHTNKAHVQTDQSSDYGQV